MAATGDCHLLLADFDINTHKHRGRVRLCQAPDQDEIVNISVYFITIQLSERRTLDFQRRGIHFLSYIRSILGLLRNMKQVGIYLSSISEDEKNMLIHNVAVPNVADYSIAMRDAFGVQFFDKGF